MSIDKFHGVHTAFYYYGKEHLFVNLYEYIKKAIEDNNLIYVYMDIGIYNEFINKLRKIYRLKGDIKLISLKNIITINRFGGFHKLKSKFNDMELKAIKDGYSGISFIWQSNLAIEETNKEYFSDFEDNLTLAIEGTKLSFLCLYDMNNYIKIKGSIDNEIIEQSLETHCYKLNKVSFTDVDILKTIPHII